MATNGICNIRVKGVEYPLYFGMLAVEEITTRLGDNPSSNFAKIVTDLVYGGMCNWANKKDMPFPSYELASDLVEDLFEEEDGNEQYTDVDKCFKESKYGSKWIKKVEEAKKKVIQETENLQKKMTKQTTRKNISKT